MQKFSEFVNEQKLQKVAKTKEDQAHKFNELYENKLKQFGVTSPIELNEEQSAEFFDYVKSISVVNEAKVNEADIKNEKDFKEYAETLLKKAHGDKYDQKIADKVIAGISKDVKGDDWGAAVGKITSGLGK
jgi:hypothetical protein